MLARSPEIEAMFTIAAPFARVSAGVSAWLTRNGGEFGFSMTYPRDNEHGFIYEPWHWALNGVIGAGGP